MAKISANGDTEMARIRSKSPSGHEYLWVITAQGRILRRTLGTGYTVYRRGWKGQKSAAVLIEMAQANNHEIVA